MGDEGPGGAEECGHATRKRATEHAGVEEKDYSSNKYDFCGLSISPKGYQLHMECT